VEIPEARDPEERRRSSRHERGERKQAERAASFEKRGILGARPELVVADERAIRLTALATEFGGAGERGERALLDAFEPTQIGAKLGQRAVEHADADVLAEVGAIDDELEAAPGALERLERRVMQDLVDLLADLAIDRRNQRFDARGDPIHQRLV